MAAPARDQHERARDGRLAILVGAIAWSSAGLIQRSLHTDAVTQVAGRALFAAIALLVLAWLTERGRLVASFRTMGRTGLLVSAATAVSTSTFLFALNHTTVANVLFMQAVGPFLAALLGWALLREQVAPRTWLAMLVALAGVAVMVGGPGSGAALGHALSFAMTFSFAATIVITRHRRDVSMLPAVCLSQVVVAVVLAPFAHPGAMDGRDVLLTGVMGGGQIGLGLAFLMIGARLIPPAEVAVISLLEVVLGPLWVWLAYAERPSPTTIAGGVVVLAAVAIQAAGDLRRDRAGPLARSGSSA